MMISFYPGPSLVYDKVPTYVKRAHHKGILSMNHRSEEFMKLCKKTITLLKDKLSIPASYSIVFASSATECWEIISQSLVEKESIHIYNGAFGQKWFDYTKRLRPQAKALVFDQEATLQPDELVFSSGEVICITQNETSNGTQVSNEIIAGIKKNNPSHLIAVDATSSMGGIVLDFKAADIWFASVQKCFGLPAGLAVMIYSPKAKEKILAINERAHYNSWAFMQEMIERWQTPYTPNVLGIYLLMSVLKDVKSIEKIHTETVARHTAWMAHFTHAKKITPLIKNIFVRSFTVIPVTGKEAHLKKVKDAAIKKGFLLGEGYGALKSSTFRIANFPALKKKEVKKLMQLLTSFH